MTQEKIALVQYRQTFGPITAPLFLEEMAGGIAQFAETERLPDYALLISGTREDFDSRDTTVDLRVTEGFQSALTRSGVDAQIRRLFLWQSFRDRYGSEHVSDAIDAICKDAQSEVMPIYFRTSKPGWIRAPLNVITDIWSIGAYALKRRMAEQVR